MEHWVQRDSQDKLDELIPEKLNVIRTMIEIKEPQRKLDEWGLCNWIRVNWNLDRADLHKLRSIKDSLNGQKMPLSQLIKTHNAATTDNAEKQINKKTNQQNKSETSHGAPANDKSKATKNAKGMKGDAKQSPQTI